MWLLCMIAFLCALVFAHIPHRRPRVPLGPFLYGGWLIVTVVR